MEKLIVYYSNTGKNKILARKLAGILRCETDRIIEKGRKEGTGKSSVGNIVKQVVGSIFKKKIELDDVKDPSSYDLVIVTAPIWGGRMPPAVGSYLSENKENIKRIAFVSVSKAGESNKDAVPDFARLAGKDPEAYLLIKETDFEKPDLDERLQAFVKNISVL